MLSQGDTLDTCVAFIPQTPAIYSCKCLMVFSQPKSVILRVLRNVGSPEAKGYSWALLLR